MTEYLFVYGTLRRADSHPMADWLGGVSVHLGPAKMAGRLYLLGNYPGMLAADGEDQWVQGELYQLPNAETAWPRLDAYEACKPDDPSRSLFVRAQGEAVTPDGRSFAAWAYFYNKEVSEEQRIADGDYAG
ncbi:MAG: gamma-glutamylcyclotransferase family protein [Verrucomicrobiota bacterium]